MPIFLCIPTLVVRNNPNTPTHNEYRADSIQLSKSTWDEQPVEDISIFTCICVYVFIYVIICVTPSGQTKNDSDLEFGTHTPIDLI